jgi:hypothetical protein
LPSWIRSRVAAGVGDHESQVGRDEALLRLTLGAAGTAQDDGIRLVDVVQAADPLRRSRGCFDLLGQGDFLLGGQQFEARHGAEVLGE